MTVAGDVRPPGDAGEVEGTGVGEVGVGDLLAGQVGDGGRAPGEDAGRVVRIGLGDIEGPDQAVTGDDLEAGVGVTEHPDALPGPFDPAEAPLCSGGGSCTTFAVARILSSWTGNADRRAPKPANEVGLGASTRARGVRNVCALQPFQAYEFDHTQRSMRRALDRAGIRQWTAEGWGAFDLPATMSLVLRRLECAVWVPRRQEDTF